MKCPFCDTEMIQIPDIAMWLCQNKKCKAPEPDILNEYANFYVSDNVATQWQARAEKAEARAEKAEAKLLCSGNNKIKCSCTASAHEEMCKMCITLNHPQYLKLQGELKAIKDNTNKFKIFELLETTFKEACIGCKYIGMGCGCVAIHNILEETTNRIIKQIGGGK